MDFLSEEEVKNAEDLKKARSDEGRVDSINKERLRMLLELHEAAGGNKRRLTRLLRQGVYSFGQSNRVAKMLEGEAAISLQTTSQIHYLLTLSKSGVNLKTLLFDAAGAPILNEEEGGDD